MSVSASQGQGVPYATSPRSRDRQFQRAAAHGHGSPLETQCCASHASHHLGLRRWRAPRCASVMCTCGRPHACEPAHCNTGGASSLDTCQAEIGVPLRDLALELPRRVGRLGAPLAPPPQSGRCQSPRRIWGDSRRTWGLPRLLQEAPPQTATQQLPQAPTPPEALPPECAACQSKLMPAPGAGADGAGSRPGFARPGPGNGAHAAVADVVGPLWNNLAPGGDWLHSWQGGPTSPARGASVTD